MNNEDIKVLENFIRVYKELNEKSTDFYFNKAEIPIEIIENLIKGYKELEKYKRKHSLVKNNYIPKSKVREKIKELEKENQALEIIHKSYKEMIEENNLISKDKIKEKIEELNNSNENYTFERLTSEDIRRTIITNLEKLLED